jgi:S-(hydroxymethyl)glutathione dehydrogenase/alcohol dehydrogenase
MNEKVMKAAILVELNKPLVVDNVRLPEELNVGQVLVRVYFSGICGSQIGEISGVKGDDKYLPHLLGHEGSGVVIEVGLGVTNVGIGDKVVLHWQKGRGIESSTPSYRWGEKKINAGWITTFNEFAVVSENRLTKIPQDSDLRVAALFGCAVTTGFGVVENNAKVRIGESVVVYGAGGVGLNIIQAASLVSAYPIIAVDLYKNKLELAKQMGATHLIDGSAPETIPDQISKISKQAGIDIFIDNTGSPSVIEMGYRITKGNGRVILVGVPKKGDDIKIYSLPMHFGKIITGSHGGESMPSDDIPRYHNFIRSDKSRLEKIISKVYPLNDINQAIDDMRRGVLAGRCLIDMSHET